MKTKTCHLLLNNGRNLQGIYSDTLAFLDGIGYVPIRLSLCLRSGEDLDHKDFDPAPHKLSIEILDQGGPMVGEGCDRIFIVANGGTTEQQWAIGRIFWLQETLRSNSPAERHHFTPCTVLNVQRDGVTMLDKTD